MRRLLTVLAIAAVVAVAVVVATPVLPRTITTHRRFAGAVTDIVVSIGAGQVTVTADRSSGALLVARRHFAVRRPDLHATVTRRTLHVDAACPTPLALACRTDLQLHVAPDVSVHVTTQSGSIAVHDVAGTVDLRSSAGGITVSGLTGDTRLLTAAGPVSGTSLAAADLTATTSAGDIRLQFAVAPDNLSATTQAGLVDLRLPDDTYRVDAHGSTPPVIGVATDPTSFRRVQARSGAGMVRIRASGP